MKKVFPLLSLRLENLSTLCEKYQELDEFVSSPSISVQKRRRAAKKTPAKGMPSRKSIVSLENTAPQPVRVNITDTTETGREQSHAVLLHTQFR